MMDPFDDDDASGLEDDSDFDEAEDCATRELLDNYDFGNDEW